MKTRILMVLCLCLLTAPVKGQTTTAYDKFDDRTFTHTSYHLLSTYTGYSHELFVAGYFSFRGKGAGHPIDVMGLVFFSRSTEWEFLKDSRLIAIVDGRRMPVGRAVNKDSKIPATVSQYEDRRLSETLQFRFSYSTLRSMATATRVEMRLGSTEFTLPLTFQDDLRLLLTKVKPLQQNRGTKN